MYLLFRDAFKAAFISLIEPLNGIPWTFCPGNHDDEGAPWDRESLLQVILITVILCVYTLCFAFLEVFSLPGCLTPDATCFNHTYTIGFTPTADARSVRLWVFDSGGTIIASLLLITLYHPSEFTCVGDNPVTRFDTISPACVADYKRLQAEPRCCPAPSPFTPHPSRLPSPSPPPASPSPTFMCM